MTLIGVTLASVYQDTRQSQAFDDENDKNTNTNKYFVLGHLHRVGILQRVIDFDVRQH